MIRTLQQDRFGSGFSGQFLGWERNGDDEGISIFIPKQGDEGVPVVENCRKPGSYLLEDKVCRHVAAGDEKLKQLEDENTQLKKIVADLTLDREMLQNVIWRKL